MQQVCEICPLPREYEELIKLGFNNVNMVLANTVETMENGPSNRLRKKNIN